MSVILKHLRKYEMHLVMLTFVIVSSVGLSLVKRQIITIPTPITKAYDVSLLPTLHENTTSFPIVSAQGVIVVDDSSGVTLYEKNADLKLLPASTTKIITALTAMDYYSLDSVLKVENVNVEGQRMGLVRGEEITFENLLYGLLVFSGNDAGEVMAQNYPGGREEFIVAMNVKARELNLDNSYFENPVGLDGYSQRSTAKDMVRLARIAVQNPIVSRIVNTQYIEVTNTTGEIKHNLESTNKLLGVVEGVKGIKTGWTENARENLITLVERDGRKVFIAVLGSQDRFGETKELIEWIYANYEWTEVNSLKENITPTN